MNFRSVRVLMGFITASALPAAAAVNFFDASDTSDVPKTLSESGIYQIIASKTPDTALKYFDVNAALWSDEAHKQRWVILPPGKHVVYNDTTDYFGYPDSTIFVKHFLHDAVTGDSSTRVYWETRLLVNKKTSLGFDDWYGYSYKWNAAGTEAVRVNPKTGFDTVFYYYPKGLTQARSYRKWRFPAQQGGCQVCHFRGTTEVNGQTVPIRGVLGFLPAQLKRPAPGKPSLNQVDSLFNAGVFTGTRPVGAQLTKRWKGLGETIPAGLTAEQRFWWIDTVARSYLAANCSGCHGTRQYNNSNAPQELNFDFHQLRPEAELGFMTVSRDVGLINQNGSASALQDGGFKFILSAQKAGLSTAPGAVWDMALPPNAQGASILHPGFPALSMMLYRQLAMRQTPWRDSLAMRAALAANDAQGWSAWIFTQPWGSQPWLDSLTAHAVTINAVTSFAADGTQMPLVATYVPDTAAMKILGEWVKNYRSATVTGLRKVRAVAGGAAASPRILGRILWVPESWTGKARLTGLTGRSQALQSAGRGRYVVPASLPAGVYLFQVGNRSFRASILN